MLTAVIVHESSHALAGFWGSLKELGPYQRDVRRGSNMGGGSGMCAGPSSVFMVVRKKTDSCVPWGESIAGGPPQAVPDRLPLGPLGWPLEQNDRHPRLIQLTQGRIQTRPIG